MVYTQAQEKVYQYNANREQHEFPLNRWDNKVSAKETEALLQDEGKWHNDFAVPGITGYVYATATDGTNLYVGGNFEVAGITVANSVAMWDGSKWHALGEGLKNGVSGDIPSVNALAYIDGKLFAGGQFSKAGNMNVNGIAFWDGEKWNSLGNDTVNGVTRKVVMGEDTLIMQGFVYSLLAHDGKIYAGGDFDYAGANKANALAAWDVQKSDWTVPENGIPENDSHTTVFSLAAHDSILYAGGVFEFNLNEIPGKNIIAWNGTSWISLGEAKEYVTSMKTAEDGKLYAAGFYSPDDSPGGYSGIGIWNGSTWTPVNGPDGYMSWVSRLNIINNEIYAGGTFTKDEEKPDKCLARWNGTSWEIIEGLGQTHYTFHQAGIISLEEIGGKLFVAGNFTRAGDVYAMNIAELDPEDLTWKMLDDGNTNMGIHDGQIMALEQHGDTLYAGGDFTVAGGVVARGIAMWNGNEWQPLGTGTAGLNGINGQVNTLLFQDNNLFAGGYFSMAGGEAAFHIARWDGTKWWPMGIGVGGIPGAEVRAIAKKDNYVYVAGYFSMTGDAENYELPVNSIARFNLTTNRWETLGRGIEVTQGVPGRVYDLEWHGDTLFVVGEFYNADGMFSENVAALVNDKWVNPDSKHSYGIHGKVMKVKSIGNELYIGGLLKMTVDEESHGIMRWGNGYWEDVGEKLSANNDDVWVNDIVAFDNGFIAGGYFNLAGGLQVNNMAYFDGTLWKAMYGGVLPGVSCIAATDSDIFVAGPRYIYTSAGVNMGIARLSFEPPVIVRNDDVVNTGGRLGIYPNPATEAARIRFTLAEPGNVSIQIFDSRGRQMMTVLNERRVAGEHTVLLNTSSLPQGIYLCRMISGDYSETVKILVQ
jgi:hypothetical protein